MVIYMVVLMNLNIMLLILQGFLIMYLYISDACLERLKKIKALVIRFSVQDIFDIILLKLD